MAGDIEYGYDWQYFDLTDVKIGQSINLSYEDEDLCSQLTDVGGRWLSAKAKIRDVGAGSGLYAGVPEDKKHVRHSDKEHEEVWPEAYLRLSISEYSDANNRIIERRGKQFNKGRIGFSQHPDTGESWVYADLVVSKEAFDEIERITSQAGVAIQADLAYESWHYTFPFMGGTYIYVDKKEDYPASLQGITINKIFPTPTTEEPVEEVELEEDDRPKHTLTDLYNRLTRVERYAASTASAAWITALAAIAIAAVAIF